MSQGRAPDGRLVGGRYRLIERVGSGGMGEVFVAEHTLIPRRFAVKLLRSDFLGDADVRARFRREAEAAARLRSPYIVEVIDFGHDADDTPYLVMEWLEGEDLRRCLAREGALPPARVLALAKALCAGAAVAHAAGVVHRDLKPENVFLVAGSGQPKLLDFGIAKLRGHTTDVHGRALGTPAYMAPEQLRSAADVDARADVYALGVMLYELLSGHLPHPGQGAPAIIAHALFEPVRPLSTLCPDLPAALAACVERAIARAPSERFASVEALGQALAEVELQLGAGAAYVDVRQQDRASALAAQPVTGEDAATHTLPALDSLVLPLMPTGAAQALAPLPQPNTGRRGRTRAALIGLGLVLLLGASLLYAPTEPARTAIRSPAVSPASVAQVPVAEAREVAAQPAPSQLPGAPSSPVPPPPPAPLRPQRTRARARTLEATVSARTPSVAAQPTPDAGSTTPSPPAKLEVQAGERTLVFQRDNPFAK